MDDAGPQKSTDPLPIRGLPNEVMERNQMNPQEPVTESRAVTKFTAQDAKEAGLPSPAAVNYMFSIAGMLYSSALVGKDMGLSKDQVTRLREFGVTGTDLELRDREAVKANSMAKMLVGHELGIEPMAALQDVDIVKAKIFIRYPQLHRLIEEKGWEIEEVERSNTRAAIKLIHATKKARSFEFTIEDAKMAGLTKRGGYNGDSPSQYELRPRVMLWSRVLSEAYRGTGGKGSIYTPEEKQEILREDVEAPEAKQPESDPYAVEMPEPKSNETPAKAPGAEAGTEAGSSGPRSQGEETAPPQAGETQAPEEPGPTMDTTPEPSAPLKPELVKPPVESFSDQRVGKLMADIDKLLPAKGRKKIVEEFLRGYFRTSNLKALLADPRMPDALTNLHALVASEKWKTPLSVDPHRFGVDTAAGYPKLIEYIAEWPEDCQVTAVGIGLALYPDSGGGDLRSYLEDPVQADTLDVEDLRAFLFVMVRVEPKYATIFVERAEDMAGIAATWDQSTPAEIVAAIEALPEPPAEGQQSLLEMIRGSGNPPQQ